MVSTNKWCMCVCVSGIYSERGVKKLPRSLAWATRRMQLSLSETDTQEVGLTRAGEGHQDSVLDMLSMRCPVDIQWKCRATECVNLEFRDVWTRDTNFGAISM